MYNQTDELAHYGVLGMKWGIHRGNASGAYAKATKKLNKLTNKVEKAKRKAEKKEDKALRKETSPFSSEKGIRKARTKAKIAQSKVSRKMYKAEKWIKSMEKEFSKTDVKILSTQMDLGKQYAAQLDLYRTMRYYH